MLRISHSGLSTGLIVLALVGCTDSPSPTDPSAASFSAAASLSEGADHIVVFSDAAVPADFENRVSTRGGTVTRHFDEVGVAVVSGLTDAAAADLASTPGVSGIERAMTVGPVADEEEADAANARHLIGASAMLAVEHPSTDAFDQLTDGEPSPTAAKYYSRQWNLRVIRADAAWAAKHPALGQQNVKVYLLDTGIDYTHPDLEGRVDLRRSISIVAPSDEEAMAAANGMLPFLDFHSHGTSVASLIVSNARLVAGVTQKTTLVAVKVHNRNNRAALNIPVYVEGIMYAARQSAEVIHLSIPAEFKRSEHPVWVEAINRATSYAHRRGAVLIAAAGNAMPPALPTDYDRDQDGFKFCNADHVICVSATAPKSATALDGEDIWASYSYYGISTIDFAGPGGSPLGSRTASTAVPLACSPWSQKFPDGRVRCAPGSTLWGNDPVWYSTGTSFGAAATSGLAALLVGTMGKNRPELIEAAIASSADDLGEPGKDRYFGNGRINVARAVDAPW